MRALVRLVAVSLKVLEASTETGPGGRDQRDRHLLQDWLVQGRDKHGKVREFKSTTKRESRGGMYRFLEKFKTSKLTQKQ